MAETAHIVTVDDEPEIQSIFATYLGARGYRVTCAENGDALRHLLATSSIDLVLLDVMMPGEDGLTLISQIRQQSTAGIIMVTALADTGDKVVGLEMGADDYLGKPFDPRELLARVKSVLRRRQPADDEQKQAAGSNSERIRFGDFVLDRAARRLRRLDGTEIVLTAMEYQLLEVFVTRSGRPLSRDQLIELAHHREMDLYDRSIDVRILRLRKKIEVDPTRPRMLQTVHGVGYVFVNPDIEVSMN
jgi:two-component system phosphate regulon response regulator OmpR